MEKIKKQEKGLNKVVFLGEIGPDGWYGEFVGTLEQCKKIAERFDLPEIKSLKVCLSIKLDGDLIRVEGNIKGILKRVCVVSLELFDEVLDTDFEALFAENVSLLKDGEMKDDIEPLDRGRLDIFEIVAEQVGLNMNPFPHKTGVQGDYVEEEQTNRPFANLKNLIKKN